MARIPLAQAPGQLSTGNQTVRTAQPAVQARSATAEGLMAVADTSARIMKLAAEADDFKNMTEASLAMQDAQMSFAQYQQENANNEGEWLNGWNQHVEGVKTKVAEMRLSPNARQQMTARLSKWATEGTIQVNSEVFRQKGKNAVQAVKNAETIGVQTGNWDVVRQAIEDLRKTGILSEEQIKALELEANGSRIMQMSQDYKAQRAEAVRDGDFVTVSQLDEDAFANNVIREEEFKLKQKQNVEGQLIADIQKQAEVDPIKAKEALKTFELPAVDRRNLEALIETELRNKQVSELSEIDDGVATGAIKRGQDVQFRFVTSPAEQKKIRDAIDSAPPSVEELTLEMLSLEEAIDSFDYESFGNNNPETMREFIGISARVSALPTHVKDQISSKWQARRSGTLPSTKESYVAAGLKVINEMVKSRRDEFFKDKVLREGKREEFARFEMDMTRMANAIKKLMPENPTPQQATEVINAVTGEAVSQQMMDAFRPIPLPTDDSKLIIPQSGFYNPVLIRPE